MSHDSSLAARLAFMGVDAATRAALRETQPLIARVLPGILDRFYRRVGETPEAKRFFSNEAHMHAAHAAQLKHWMHIASGQFDQNYIQSVTRIGEAHHRLGLEPRW